MLFVALTLLVLGVLYSYFKGQGVGMNTLSVGRRTPLQTFMFLGLEMPHIAFGFPVVLGVFLYYCDSVSFFTMILVALFWPLSLGVTALCLVVQS